MKMYYIGGSPCSGKSTVAQMLAREHGLYYFQVDDSLGKYASMGAKKEYPVCSRQWKMSPDATWLRDVRQQCEDELQFYREIFPFIIEEMQMLSHSQDIIAEGAAFLPELAKGAGIAVDRYVCMTPTKEFQVAYYAKREWVPLMLEGCSDKAQAFANWMERDALFAGEVRWQCEACGYRSIVVDGTERATLVKKRIEQWFGVK